jgi:hypothetical protein
MPLDHYVPQVHLRGWLSPNSGRLHATRKSDLKNFSPGTKSVCAIQDGSTNQYLADDRLLEQYLEEFEPKYSIWQHYNVGTVKKRSGEST